MMNLLVEDIKNILVDEGFVYFLGDSPQNPNNLQFGCSLELEPTEPAEVVSIYSVPGYVDSLALDRESVSVESIQIRIRSYDIKEGEAKLQEIKDHLTSIDKVEIGTTTPYRIEQISQSDTISFNGEADDIKAYLYSVTFDVIRIFIK